MRHATPKRLSKAFLVHAHDKSSEYKPIEVGTAKSIDARDLQVVGRCTFVAVCGSDVFCLACQERSVVTKCNCCTDMYVACSLLHVGVALLYARFVQYYNTTAQPTFE